MVGAGHGEQKGWGASFQLHSWKRQERWLDVLMVFVKSGKSI